MTQHDLFKPSLGPPAVNASFSADGRRRHWLTHGPDHAPRWLVWLMLNPSRAGGMANPAAKFEPAPDNLDPTLRRCRSFTEAAGYDGFHVYNLYTLIDPSPLALLDERPEDLAGDEEWLRCAARLGHDIVVAWGANPKAVARSKLVWDIILSNHADRIYALQTTKDGHPGHPLYLPGSCKLSRWEPPW